MIQAELKSIGTSDAHVPDFDLAHYHPENAESFYVYIDAYIGSKGETGRDVFGFTVCSPQWFVDHPAEKGFWLGRFLLLWRWDYALLHRVLSDLCRRMEGATWEEVALKLSRYSHWEFEDYTGT